MSATVSPQPQPGVLSIEAYVPGATGAGGTGTAIKLSSNESALGPSPQAVAAYRALAGHIERYPDGGAVALREAIGAAHGLAPQQIVCGAGSDELLNLIAAAYLGPGTEALFSQYGFLVYKIATLARGATPVAAPEKRYTTDVDALLARVTDKTRVVFLANPNNPTGTCIPQKDVLRLHRGLPDNVLLVLDAAYAEYVSQEDYNAGAELVTSSQNTVMARTFSKAYGLAGLRLGWAYCPELIADVLNRIRGPFNVNAAAMAAGIAALADQDHLHTATEHNDRWRLWMAAQLSGLNLEVTPSFGNFLLVGFPQEARWNAAAADKFLQSRNILVRPMGAYGLGHTLRITIGSEPENKAVVAALTEFLQGRD